MSRRNDYFGLRVTADERRLISVIAQRLERSDCDAVRSLIRAKARELGVLPEREAPKASNQVAE